MPDTSLIGPRRRLLRLADEVGVIVGLALDHRDSFRVVLERRGVTGLSRSQIGGIKTTLVTTLAPAASALMLDMELGAPALEVGAVPPSIGLIMPLEEQGYEAMGDQRITKLLADFTPRIALSWGADACKVLLPIRPDLPRQADQQLDLISRCVIDAHAVGLPMVVEPTVYRLEAETQSAYRGGYTDLVLNAVALVAVRGPDLIKAQFPVLDDSTVDQERSTWADACRSLEKATCGIPWVLLGAETSPGVFIDQLCSAGAAGASGFLAGRAIWSDALNSRPAETERLAREVSLPRLKAFAEIARMACRPLESAHASDRSGT